VSTDLASSSRESSAVVSGIVKTTGWARDLVISIARLSGLFRALERVTRIECGQVGTYIGAAPVAMLWGGRPLPQRPLAIRLVVIGIAIAAIAPALKPGFASMKDLLIGMNPDQFKTEVLRRRSEWVALHVSIRPVAQEDESRRPDGQWNCVEYLITARRDRPNNHAVVSSSAGLGTSVGGRHA